MACEFPPDACRRKHIKHRLADAEEDRGDYEARCPVCGHNTFRVSEPRIRKYRHVWTCACKQCGCTAGALRVALLKLDIMGWCLGIYDGPVEKNISQEAARAMDLVIRDIIAVPHLKPADMRLALADAQGRKIPDEFGPFVKFCVSIGISRSRAQELAPMWCRPPDCPPQTRGAGSDTSRSTDASGVVKRAASEPRSAPVLGNRTAGFGHLDIPDMRRSEDMDAGNVQMPISGEQIKQDKPIKPAA